MNFKIEGGDISDGYHTFKELYEFRMLYNALFVNQLREDNDFVVQKSKRHSDGELCFGGGWFIVVVQDVNGNQISNHYKLEHWDLFNIDDVDIPIKYNGHTPKDTLDVMRNWLGCKENNKPI